MHIKRRQWQQVDNVANLFLATYNNRDPRVMRICCTLKEDIQPDILQEAANAAVRIRPQFQVRIERGMFWRYIEESQDMPNVSEEAGRICPPLYFQDRPERPLYKISYHNNRINMDIFHAISDGAGAVEFVNILVVEYLRRIYPSEIKDICLYDDATSEELTEDSFKTNFEKDRQSAFVHEDNKTAYHPRSRKLPLNQLQFFEVQMPLSVVRDRAKNFDVSISSYIGAAMMLGIMDTMPRKKRKKPITISMPVNLRSYYKSDSLRNFFNSINITHVYDGSDSIRTLSAKFQRLLTEELEPEKIKNQMSYFQGIQNHWSIRAVPLAIKELVLKFFAKQYDRSVTAVLSNLGAVKFPDLIADHIEHYAAYCSSENPFFVLCSFRNVLNACISYPYSDTGMIRKFVGVLTEKGIPVRLYATEVVR